MINPLPPGQPGVSPRWTSSAKTGVGTAVPSESRVWFTLSHGIVDEVYHPYIDQADIRDFGLLVADGRDFFSEEKRDTTHAVRPLAPGVPGYVLTNTCREGRYKITKTVVTDPQRDVLLQKIKFEALQGTLADYSVYALLAPHLKNQGAGNSGWTGDYKGVPMLFAERDDVALALACSAPWRGRSCGYVGVSDGWQDIAVHKKMTWFYPAAPDGNIALTGEIDLQACGGEFTLALGFDDTWAGAGQQARATLLWDFERIARAYTEQWQAYQAQRRDLEAPGRDGFHAYRTSVAVLKTHQGKRFAGGIIASLSIPWGFAHGDKDLAGYHVIWPRDQAEAAGALLAAGDPESARATLFYLMTTQEADGHWPQNMRMQGNAYWDGIQTDETALPILLADVMRRQDALDGLDPWPMVRRAAAFLVANGPCTAMDRWEENAGFSPFTLAATVAALLAAADFADAAGDPCAAYLRETADCWNDGIERWTYVAGTDLANEYGVDGYYVRIGPPAAGSRPVAETSVTLKNLPAGQNTFPAWQIVSPDALALARFGLRAPDDPRLVSTVKVVDATLKVETRTGPAWHRYTHDGYGETEDGGPYRGVGVGRCWPLLAGERAQYELSRGSSDEARRLLEVMTQQTSPGGLLPEQVWDADDIPERELFNGQPSRSGMPLVWAHAELVKLVRALHDGVFVTPPQPVQRYLKDRTRSPLVPWRFDVQTPTLPPGKRFRIEVDAPAVVRWSADGWRTVQNAETQDSGLGVHFADLMTDGLSPGAAIAFTFCWRTEDRWEGRNFEARVADGAE